MIEPKVCPVEVIDGVRSLVRGCDVKCDRCEGKGYIPPVYENCPDCDGRCYITGLGYSAKFEALLKQLQWSGGYYCIPNWNGMYIGIELDGYTHS